MPSSIPSIIGSGALQKNAATVLKQVEKSGEESFIVTNNKPRIVVMSIYRYQELKALEDLEFIPHRKTSPQQVRASFEKTGLYSKKFLDDMEDGLRKSSLYATNPSSAKRH